MWYVLLGVIVVKFWYFVVFIFKKKKKIILINLVMIKLMLYLFRLII